MWKFCKTLSKNEDKKRLKLVGRIPRQRKEKRQQSFFSFFFLRNWSGMMIWFLLSILFCWKFFLKHIRPVRNIAFICTLFYCSIGINENFPGRENLLCYTWEILKFIFICANCYTIYIPKTY